MLQKERASGSYRLSVYLLAKTVSEAPIKLLLPTVFFVIFYWMSNLNPYFGAFISALLLQLLVAFAGESIGLLIGVTIYDVKVAMTGARPAATGAGGKSRRGAHLHVAPHLFSDAQQWRRSWRCS